MGSKPEQFIVEDNGVRQSVQVDEDPDSWGVSLVVAVQCSRSAPLEFKKLKGLGAMIDGIVGDAPHEVAILAYGERPYVLDDFSGNPDAVPLALSRIKDCGDFHAASIDAVYYATQMLRRRQSHYRRAILLISETPRPREPLETPGGSCRTRSHRHRDLLGRLFPSPRRGHRGTSL